MTALSVGDALAVSEHVDWLRSTGRSPNTVEDRVRLLIRLNGWLQLHAEPHTLITATADDLAKWQRSLSKLALESISTYVGHARGFYAWLARFRHLPDAGVLLERPPVPHRLPRPISDESLQVILHVSDGALLLAFLLAAFCGLRVGEIARLQRHHVRDHDEPPIVLVEGKGGRHRAVRMPNDLGGVLRSVGVPLRGNIVLSPEGHPYSPNRLSQLTNDLLHSNGIPDTMHSLRHWYGTNTYRMTRDLRLVQTMMGHASTGTTALYTAFAPENADEMASKLDVSMRALLGRPALRAVPDS